MPSRVGLGLVESRGFAEEMAPRRGFVPVEQAVGRAGYLQRHRPSALAGGGVVDSAAQLLDAIGEVGVLDQAGLDPTQGVEHGRVVAASIETADLGQGEVG